MKPTKKPKLKEIEYPQDEEPQHVKLLGNEDSHLPVKTVKDFDLNTFPDTEIECVDDIHNPQRGSKSPRQTLKNDLDAHATDPNKGMVFVRTPRLNFPHLHNGCVMNLSHLHEGHITKFAPLYKGMTPIVREPNVNVGGRLGIYSPLNVQKPPAIAHGNLYPMRLQVRQPYLQPPSPAKMGFDCNVDYRRPVSSYGKQQLLFADCSILSTGSDLHHLQKLEQITGYGFIEIKGKIKINKLCIHVENSRRCPQGSGCPFLHEMPSGESSRGNRNVSGDKKLRDGKGRDQGGCS